MEEVLRRVVELWRRQEIELCPPVSRGELEAVWNRLDQQLSKDVIEFYGMFGGFRQAEMDDRHLDVWRMEEIASRNERGGAEGVFFGDFLISSHVYSFKHEDASRSSVWIQRAGGEMDCVSPTVEEFLTCYLDDPDSIGLMWKP